MMSYFTADGMDSTLNWEAIREGLTDMKYLYTLERLLAERPASPAAIKGRALLDEIRCATPQHRVYILSGNSIRNIPDAARLENWRGRLVESIKAIQ
jgi:hypothetical protein